jgi:hypothetical protein
MKAIDRTSRARAPASKKEEASRPRPLQVILTEAEREVLLKACKRYRYMIPGYIRSRQPEICVIDAIIHKLS